MLLLIIAAAAGSTAAPQWHQENAFPPPEVVIAKVEECGVEGSQVVYDDLLQEDVVKLPTEATWSDAQVLCVAQTSFDTGHHFELPEQYAASFYSHLNVISHPWNVELARSWLEERGKLDGLPVRDASMSDELFAKMLEAHCGPDAAGMLSSEFGPHAIAPPSPDADFSDYERIGAAALCLGSAGVLTDYEIGLIGNESIAEQTDDLALPDFWRLQSLEGVSRVSA